MKLAFCTYGHTRTPEHAHVPRNSVLLTHYHALRGCDQFADEVVDYSPLVGSSGIKFDARYVSSQLEPADALYCQAAVSLEVMQRFREIAPGAPIILQRDSTHALAHRNLIDRAMERHGIRWHHYYHDEWNLDRECAEYDLADRIFVLSDWVCSTFEQHGLGWKTTHFAPQTIEPSLWKRTSWSAKPPIFTVVHLAQLGLRKGTFELLDAWRSFWPRFPESKLVLCGVIEHGASKELARALDEKIAASPHTVRAGWVPMDRLVDVYAHAHLLCMPSWEDGSTCTGPEAGYCGVPILATRNAGIDLLEHGVTGFEVPVGDAGQLAEALCEAAADRARLERMADTLHARALERCSPDAFAAGVARELAAVFAP